MTRSVRSVGWLVGLSKYHGSLTSMHLSEHLSLQIIYIFMLPLPYPFSYQSRSPKPLNPTHPPPSQPLPSPEAFVPLPPNPTIHPRLLLTRHTLKVSYQVRSGLDLDSSFLPQCLSSSLPLPSHPLPSLPSPHLSSSPPPSTKSCQSQDAF